MAAPDIAISTNDITTSASRQNTAIFLVQAITKRGKINKPVRITSDTEFYQEFREEKWVVKTVSTKMMDFAGLYGYAPMRAEVSIAFSLATDTNLTFKDIRR